MKVEKGVNKRPAVRSPQVATGSVSPPGEPSEAKKAKEEEEEAADSKGVGSQKGAGCDTGSDTSDSEQTSSSDSTGKEVSQIVQGTHPKQQEPAYRQGVHYEDDLQKAERRLEDIAEVYFVYGPHENTHWQPGLSASITTGNHH